MRGPNPVGRFASGQFHCSRDRENAQGDADRIAPRPEIEIRSIKNGANATMNDPENASTRNKSGKDSTSHSGNAPATRTVASTQSEMTEIILPNDTNTLGNLLGGRLMHFIDLTGAMAAYRHSRTHVVTAAMDHIDFIRPVHLGDLVTLKSCVNRAFTSSMEVGVKAWAENTRTGEVVHVASAYLVFVAIDEHGLLVKVPQIAPQTPDELRRYEGALRRREHRDQENARRKEAKLATVALNEMGAES
jgi:acyl-CoA hydrolase